MKNKTTFILICATIISFVVLSFLPGFSHYEDSIQKQLAPSKEIVSATKDDQESPATNETSAFEKAVEIIKKYETLHQPRHWPLVGYGHKVLPGEKFSRSKALSEKEADALLRKDLLKNCAVFREFGADSLLLGTLAYNIGSGAAKRSSVATKLKAGDRNIRTSYIAHCKYRGKEHSTIKKRRIEEFDALFSLETSNTNK